MVMTLENALPPIIVIKLIHTVFWAFFAACVGAVPVLALMGRCKWAQISIAIVLVEILIVELNGGRCPLTNVAARYTRDRADNFDIYLPVSLARHNKAIFGTLFLAGLCVYLWRCPPGGWRRAGEAPRQAFARKLFPCCRIRRGAEWPNRKERKLRRAGRRRAGFATLRRNAWKKSLRPSTNSFLAPNAL
jgi:hypothetical protein